MAMIVPSSPGAGSASALRDLLNHAVVYEDVGAPIPWSLLRYGVGASAALIILSLIGLALNPTGIGHGHFFLLLRHAEGGLASILHGLAIPSLVGATGALGLDVYLGLVPTTEPWRYAVVAQVGGAALAAVVAVLFLGLILLNLAIWIAIGCLLLAVIGTLLAAFAGG